MDCNPPSTSVHGDSPGKNTGVDCHALLPGIFPTQGLNPGPCIAGRFFTIWATKNLLCFLPNGFQWYLPTFLYRKYMVVICRFFFLTQMALYCLLCNSFLTEPDTSEIFPCLTHRPIFKMTATEWCSIAIRVYLSTP